VSRLRIGACGLALVLGLALSLGGCVTAPPRPTPAVSPWEQSRSRLQELTHFELKGRVGVVAGNDGFSAALEWQQQGAHSTVALNGPLGIGGLQIVRDGPSLTVRNSRGQLLDSEAARAELASKLGFEPPLDSLRYWLVGVPDPAQPAQELLDGADQRLLALDQDGWHIVYGAYVPGAGGWLPQKLTLDRGTVRVRVVVESWQA